MEAPSMYFMEQSTKSMNQIFLINNYINSPRVILICVASLGPSSCCENLFYYHELK